MPVNVMEGTLGAVLYNSRIITENDIAAALAEQKTNHCRFGEALVKLEIVTQEDIDWALSSHLDIPYIRLNQQMIDPEAIKLLPAALCRKYKLIPLIRAADELSIAISDPLDKEALAAAEKISGCRINPSVAMMREISEMIDLCYGIPAEELPGFESDSLSAEELAIINSDTSGQKLLDWLLAACIQQQWSSFTFEPVGERVLITSRKGGRSREVGRLRPENHTRLSAFIAKSAAFLPSQEQSSSGQISFNHYDNEFHFQALSLKGEGGEYITIRRHIVASVPCKSADLKLSPFQRKQFETLLTIGHGMFMFASRSLHERCRFMDLVLEELDTEGLSVLVLGAEPARMHKRFPRISLPDNDRARGRLVMDALEHAPDILVIEDATNLEPFTAAARAAMRGKLVLVGFDIRGTQNLIEHLVRYRQRNAFLTPFLSAIVSVKGIQLLCPGCRKPYNLPREELFALHLKHPPENFFNATGCEQCDFTGITERMFLTDIICFDKKLHEAFECADDARTFLSMLHADGYQGIDQEGEALIRSGAVSPEEYIAAVIQ